MTTINEVLEKLEYLKLKTSYSYLQRLNFNDEIRNEDLEVLNAVLTKEVEAKFENTRLYNIKIAAFPYVKTIDDYDFSFQPSLREDKIRSIIESNFHETGANIIFIGNPGVGKTHLAISIGHSIAIKRNSVYFIKFNKLIDVLRTAYQEGNLSKKLKLYFKYRLLIIDELGFNEISSLEAKLFFQLIDMRYNIRSTVITSNISFDKWVSILGNDEMITKAILDRLLHQSYLFNITGVSYRLKDKMKLKNKSGEI